MLPVFGGITALQGLVRGDQSLKCSHFSQSLKWPSTNLRIRQLGAWWLKGIKHVFNTQILY